MQATIAHYSDADQATVLADRFFSLPVSSMTAFHHSIQTDVQSLLVRIQIVPPTLVTLLEIQQAIAISGPWKGPRCDGIPFLYFH